MSNTAENLVAAMSWNAQVQSGTVSVPHSIWPIQLYFLSMKYVYLSDRFTLTENIRKQRFNLIWLGLDLSRCQKLKRLSQKIKAYLSIYTLSKLRGTRGLKALNAAAKVVKIATTR